MRTCTQHAHVGTGALGVRGCASSVILVMAYEVWHWVCGAAHIASALITAVIKECWLRRAVNGWVSDDPSRVWCGPLPSSCADAPRSVMVSEASARNVAASMVH